MVFYETCDLWVGDGWLSGIGYVDDCHRIAFLTVHDVKIISKLFLEGHSYPVVLKIYFLLITREPKILCVCNYCGTILD